MNWTDDKVDVGRIKHVFKTDKFTRQGLSVLFDNTIRYSFRENDLVAVDVFGNTTVTDMKQYRVNNKAFTLTMDTPILVSGLRFTDTNGADIYKALFEQLDNYRVNVVLLKTDVSRDGTYFDNIIHKYMYYDVHGVYDVKIEGKHIGSSNGVYSVKPGEWEKIVHPDVKIDNVSYNLKCSAVSVDGLVRIILPYNSGPDIVPELIPEVTNELKLVDHMYLSPNVLLLNLVRLSNSNSGYKENLGSNSTKTNLTEKLNFSSFVPDFNLYFAGHTITKSIRFGNDYTYKYGNIYPIVWDYAKVSSVSNVYLDRIGINDTHKIDGISEFTIHDTVIIRKQEENEENGVYTFNGEQFTSNYEYGDLIDRHYIIREGKKSGFGVHVFGVFGYLVNFSFTSGKITTPLGHSKVDPEVIQPELVQPTQYPTQYPTLQPEVIQPEVIQPEVIQPEVIQPDMKSLDVLIYVLIGSVFATLFMKAVRKTNTS
jgi:hypothetical protein